MPAKTNTQMPGHPRYQPLELIAYYGYDYYAQWLLRVEFAILDVLGELGFISAKVISQLTAEVRQNALDGVTTTAMDYEERGDKSTGKKGTNHDIEALKLAALPFLPPAIRSWFHFAATSYDIVETAIALMLKQSYLQAIRPQLNQFCRHMAKKARAYARVPMLGRTHGQPANPITGGFWLATILGRVLDIREHLDQFADELVGKFSGPVGASNAIVAFGIDKLAKTMGKTSPEELPSATTVEALVMKKLGLSSPAISTQVTPPESYQRFLEELGLLSGALNQFAVDVRLLYINEIGEVSVASMAFDPTANIGSSAMSHKINPIDGENTGGMFEVIRALLTMVMSLSVSWLQRDLTGSVVRRFLSMVPVLVFHSLKTMTTVIDRLVLDTGKMTSNLERQGDIILSELFQLALRYHGYPGNAHQLITGLVKQARDTKQSLYATVSVAAAQDEHLLPVWESITGNEQLSQFMRDPKLYIGNAPEKAEEIADLCLSRLAAEAA